jgi:hypothetical protein
MNARGKRRGSGRRTLLLLAYDCSKRLLCFDSFCFLDFSLRLFCSLACLGNLPLVLSKHFLGHLPRLLSILFLDARRLPLRVVRKCTVHVSTDTCVENILQWQGLGGKHLLLVHAHATTQPMWEGSICCWCTRMPPHNRCGREAFAAGARACHHTTDVGTKRAR